MNIYVLTENYYLFYGIECSLSSKPNYQCIHLKPNDERYIDIAKNDPGDIFVVVPEYTKLDFSMLMAINETNASVIIANNYCRWNVSDVFRFSSIPQKVLFKRSIKKHSSFKISQK